MFLDQAEITVEAGGGGNGVRSVRREKYVPFGGPDGGDGGRGGDVVLVGHAGMNTLYELTGRPFYRAGSGGHGGGTKRSGRNGEDVVLSVPLGAIVYHAETGDLLGEILAEGQRLVVAHGGKGGLGNVHFTTATRQAPDRATPGKPGERLKLRLELKLIAEVGLVGLPNAGKSTLIRALTHARAKVAAYPFTTLQPVLGTMPLSDYSRIIIADIPGLIAGAHEGVGMGYDFLRHIERTLLLVYVLDFSEDAASAWSVLRREIEFYDPTILQRPALAVLNKIDLVPADEHADLRDDFVRETGFDPADCLLVSGLEGTGIDAVKERIETTWRSLAAASEEETS